MSDGVEKKNRWETIEDYVGKGNIQAEEGYIRVDGVCICHTKINEFIELLKDSDYLINDD